MKAGTASISVASRCDIREFQPTALKVPAMGPFYFTSYESNSHSPFPVKGPRLFSFWKYFVTPIFGVIKIVSLGVPDLLQAIK
jgi:hypothetical protein